MTTTTKKVFHDTETQKKAFEALKKGAEAKRTKEALNKVQCNASTWFYLYSGLASLKRDKTTFTKDKAHVVLTINKEIVRLQPSKKAVLVRVNKKFTENHPQFKYELHESWSQPYAVDISMTDLKALYTETKTEAQA